MNRYMNAAILYAFLAVTGGIFYGDFTNGRQSGAACADQAQHAGKRPADVIGFSRFLPIDREEK